MGRARDVHHDAATLTHTALTTVIDILAPPGRAGG
jgi:hypothetical protein